MKRFATLLVLLVCALAGGARWIDLTQYTDPATGFVTMGPLWVRYAVIGGALVLCALAALLLAPTRPGYLQHRCVPTGISCILCSMLFALLSGTRLAVFGQLARVDQVLCVLWLCTALWLLLAALSRFWQQTSPPTGSALWGLLGTLSLYLLTVMRFGFKPSGLVRIAPTVQVFSALMALLFINVFVRALYLPRVKCGRWLYFTGCGAFLLCTCLELPQSIRFWQLGSISAHELGISIGLALLGLLGGVSAVAAAGGEASQPEEEPADAAEPC